MTTLKKRYGLRNINLLGKHASTDQEVAETFPAQLSQLIEKKGCLPQQVFNASENGLVWKKMPMQTFISECKGATLGFKAAKDRISLLLCTNANGDYA